MAKAAKKINNTNKASIQSDNDNAKPLKENSSFTTQQKVRIGIGMFFLMVGAFLTFAMIGYIFSWQQDMDKLLSSNSIFSFLFDNQEPVNNFCGRLGAAAAHLFIYKSFGLAAFFLTIWLIGMGWNIINKNQAFPLLKGLKWMAMGFLLFCPLLSFIFHGATFPVGGALGKWFVDWMGGFAGNAGIIIMLLIVSSFFIYVVFEWRLKPLYQKAKSLIPETNHAIAKGEDNKEQEFKGFQNPVAADEAFYDGVEQAVHGNKMKNGPHSTLSKNDTELLDDEEILEEEEGLLTFNLIEKEVPQVGTKLENPKTDALDIITNAGSELIINMPKEEIPLIIETPKEDKLLAAVNNDLPKINEIIIEEKAGIVLEIPKLEMVAEPEATYSAQTREAVLEKEEAALLLVNEDALKPAPALHGSHKSIESGEPYDPSLDLPDFKFPTLDLLADIDQNAVAIDREELERNNNQIRKTLSSFGIEIQRISATVGPTVTLYEIIPQEGVRISKIKNLEDDIALNLAALGIRIIAPIPGRGTIGIEVPNTNKQIVPMKALLASEKFVNSKMSLPIALGKKIDNENYIVDLATMPHLLMAGATGQGKSVGINAILISLLYKKHPSQLKFVMVDPKKVELSIYRVIEKHYLAMLPNEEEPIITDTKKVVNTLNALCIEMDNRYELLKDAGARNIKEYNEKFIKRKLNPQHGHKYLPFIVLVIDEFADLIMTAGKEVEMPIARLAQLARAVGIHIIIATQRPSVNVITGIIKANFPARIAFKVSAKVDSRTILDAGGADQLIGRGDMLVSNGSDLMRVQCAFVDTPEVERIVDYIGSQRGYSSALMLPEYEGAENEGIDKESIDLSKRDKMFEDAARLVVASQSGSTSMLQRKFNLGYNRAGRIMDQLEAAGIVGATQGSKPRDVLISTEFELDNLLKELF